jgi:hypothetical protein
MDTEEMYERGIADAERGDPHPFYYQHYYHYRRGYDRARRRRAGVWGLVRSVPLRVLAVLALLMVGGAAFATIRMRATTSAPSARVLGAVATPATPTPVRTPIYPTATPSPAPPPAALHVGGVALVSNTEGHPLRGRLQPSLRAAPRASFAQGERVRILAGPTQADGYIWWQIEGQGGVGWSAEQSHEGIIWLQPVDS